MIRKLQANRNITLGDNGDWKPFERKQKEKEYKKTISLRELKKIKMILNNTFGRE